MAHNLLIHGLSWGDHPLTNHLLSCWDIQVCPLRLCKVWMVWSFSVGNQVIEADGSALKIPSLTMLLWFLESTMTFGNLHEGRYVFHLNAIRRSGHRGTSCLNWWMNFALWACSITNFPHQFPDMVYRPHWEDKMVARSIWRRRFLLPVVPRKCWWWHLPHRIFDQVGTVWP